ncbi:TPA: hypothetical protein ACH3X1_000393 [Trebouxia sp. C0004]
MVNKPSTVDEAIAYIWDLPDTVLKPSEKHSLTALLAEKTDAVAGRYFSAPGPELWVGTLKELLKPTASERRFPSNAMGLPPCTSTAPRPTPQASQMTSKGLFRSGKASTRALVKAVLIPPNASLHSADHTKDSSLLVSFCNGATSAAQPVTNLAKDATLNCRKLTAVPSCSSPASRHQASASPFRYVTTFATGRTKPSA